MRKLSIPLITIYLGLTLSSYAQATNTLGKGYSGKSYIDPVNDIHHSSKGTCQAPEIDIIKTEISRDANDFTVTITTKNEIKDGPTYKEYYFWLDVDPARRIGYQPYNPHSVAWPNMFADYRIFASMTFNDYNSSTERRVALQDCKTHNCAEDFGLYNNSNINVKIDSNKIIFKWPTMLIPRLDKAKNFLLGITTYYQRGYCNGEDDSPQWGKNAFLVEIKKAITPDRPNEGLLN